MLATKNTQGANLIKPFLLVTCKWANKARVLVPGTPFQTSLMFAIKAGAYPRGRPEIGITLR